MKLRRFNAKGIEAFTQFLSQCRLTPSNEDGRSLLTQRSLTEEMTPDCEIAEAKFETKADAAEFLSNALASIPSGEVEQDAGLWTWLALFFLDSICPVRDGKRLVRNDYHYVFEPRNNRHFYRHLLFLPWRVRQLAPVHNRLFLKSRISTLDKLNTEVMKRLYLTRIPSIFEVLDRLYWDEKSKSPRKGITGNKIQAGDLTHRLPIRIRQLEKTYDLQSLNAGQLLELLGDEFSFARGQQQELFSRTDENGSHVSFAEV